MVPSMAPFSSSQSQTFTLSWASAHLVTKHTVSNVSYQHSFVDDSVLRDIWRSDLCEWTKRSNHGDKINVSKSTVLLASAHGLPPDLRSEIWFVISGAKELMHRHSRRLDTKYQTLSSNEDTKFLQQINKDYARTFVTKDLPMIRHKIQHSLRRMLIAYANLNPVIGYAQGMNMIAAFVLRQFLQHDEFFHTNYDHGYRKNTKQYRSRDRTRTVCNSQTLHPTNSSNGFNACNKSNHLNVHSSNHHESSTSMTSSSSLSPSDNQEDPSSSSLSADGGDDDGVQQSQHVMSMSSSLMAECDHNESIVEEHAFWTFAAVMSKCSQLFGRNLSGYRQSVQCLTKILELNDHELWSHFDALGLDTLFTGVFLKWFTSLFAFPSFNLAETLKLWDLWLLNDGDFAVFIKFAFLIFEDHKAVLMEMDEIDIPAFCTSSQCTVTDKMWMLRLNKLKMKRLFIGMDHVENGPNHQSTDHSDDDDEKDPMEAKRRRNRKGLRMQRVEIKSISIEAIRAEKQKQFGEYRVDIECVDGVRWSVWKRYSDFERLCHKLTSFGIESDDHAVFPSKSWLYKSNNESLMKARRIILNEYLKNVHPKYNAVNRRKSKRTKGLLLVLHAFSEYATNHPDVK